MARMCRQPTQTRRYACVGWVESAARCLAQAFRAETTRDHLKVFSSSSAAQLLSPWFDRALLDCAPVQPTPSQHHHPRREAPPAQEAGQREHGTYSSERGPHTIKDAYAFRVGGDCRENRYLWRTPPRVCHRRRAVHACRQREFRSRPGPPTSILTEGLRPRALAVQRRAGNDAP